MKNSVNSSNSIKKTVTGTLELVNSMGFVGKYFIMGENLNGAKNGDIVKIEKIDDNPNILSYKVIKIIKSKEDFLKDILIDVKDKTSFLTEDQKWQNSFDELNILIKEGVNINFPKEVLEEVDNMSEKIEESEIKKRKDLRNLFTITIDGPDTKDIDDAISVELLENGDFKLYVHIADVSHYVKEGSLTQIEALKRGTSIYFLDKVIPMIPEKLSNGLCSLNPFEDKLTMTCEMIIDKNGKIDFKKSKVYESVIKSNARTTYKEVQDIFQKKLNSGDLEFGGVIDENLIKMIQNSYKLSEKLNISRKKEGELIFDNTEIKINLDEKRNPKKFEKYKMFESNDLIKAFMVAANETVSKLYGNGPFLHRTHETPSEEKIELLKNILAYLEVDIGNLEINSNNLDKLLEKIKGHEKEKVLKNLILRTLKLAKYTHTLQGHHGLALTNYSHFTSPIRRYPDFQIHDIIKKHLKGENIDIKNLEEVAKICSEKEIQAEKIEKDINILQFIKYLEDKIGKEFGATIMQIDEKSVRVELNFAGINGNLIIPKENGYFYKKIEKGLFEIETKNGEKIKLGDEIKVKLLSLDKANLNINFSLI